MENDGILNNGSTVTESTEINIAEIQSKEASLNEVLELLKSKNLSKEEHDRLWQEAYEKSFELLEYKIMMGKVILDTESASGQRSDLVGATCKVSKKDVYEALGLTKSQADDYQLLAKHPDSVTEAEKWASENKEVITTYRVLTFIKKDKEKTILKEDSKSTSASKVICDKKRPNLSKKESSETSHIEWHDFTDDYDIQDFIESNTTKGFIQIEVPIEKAQAFMEELQADEDVKSIRFGILK